MNRAQRRARGKSDRPSNWLEQKMLDDKAARYVCPGCGATAKARQRDGWRDWEVGHRLDCPEVQA